MSDGKVRVGMRRGIESEVYNSYGGFDPGSGLTLAACLSHASRADLWGNL